MPPTKGTPLQPEPPSAEPALVLPHPLPPRKRPPLLPTTYVPLFSEPYAEDRLEEADLGPARGPPRGGGFHGPGEGPPGGAPGALGGPIAHTPQLPFAPAADTKASGGLPQIFTGDWALAEDFMDELRAYLGYNVDVPGFNSPIRKVALALTLIKGPAVVGWRCDMGTWIDSLDPIADNIPVVWEQFQVEFQNQFMDPNVDNTLK
ncbi:hypothetical protein F5148DRAFT_1373533 [Russula earlei]|uniref:Uncharacterized protein n=1 Tax=Russula earlei TaxID=71964 RepID=A0ACC0UJI9_9AGAM|nr:hypothetical protein F5148DRAFT_1373533 [Russula earlei]